MPATPKHTVGQSEETCNLVLQKIDIPFRVHDNGLVTFQYIENLPFQDKDAKDICCSPREQQRTHGDS